MLLVWIILFMFYSLLGAMVEHIMYYFGSLLDPTTPGKAMANPILTGFPIYGIGAFSVAAMKYNIVDRFKMSIGTEFLLYAFVLMGMEAITGKIVGAGSTSYVKDSQGRNLVWSWDYSKNNYNLGGIVDPMHSIAFAIVGLIVARVHPVLEEKLSCLAR